jgi:uncharacterized HAD superfamily protein
MSKSEKEQQRMEIEGRVRPWEIAFDIDGVFADTFHTFVERANSAYGYAIDYQDITEYEFARVIEIEPEVSDKILRSLLDFPLESGIRPLEGAVEVLTRLAAAAPLLFVTARSEKTGILEWVRHHLPEVDMELIGLEATHTHEAKLPVLLGRNVKYFVEDCLETCYLLEASSITPIVFRQPWNRKHHPFAAVNSWAEISAMIKW